MLSLATELPATFNSTIWRTERDDSLAVGNLTDATVFEGTLPATSGILITCWDIGVGWGIVGFPNARSTVLALISGGLILFRHLAVRPGLARPVQLLRDASSSRDSA